MKRQNRLIVYCVIGIALAGTLSMALLARSDPNQVNETSSSIQFTTSTPTAQPALTRTPRIVYDPNLHAKYSLDIWKGGNFISPWDSLLFWITLIVYRFVFKS
jgi:hypothetical protein